MSKKGQKHKVSFPLLSLSLSVSVSVSLSLSHTKSKTDFFSVLKWCNSILTWIRQNLNLFSDSRVWSVLLINSMKKCDLVKVKQKLARNVTETKNLRKHLKTHLQHHSLMEFQVRYLALFVFSQQQTVLNGSGLEVFTRIPS